MLQNVGWKKTWNVLQVHKDGIGAWHGWKHCGRSNSTGWYFCCWKTPAWTGMIPFWAYGITCRQTVHGNMWLHVVQLALGPKGNVQQGDSTVERFLLIKILSVRMYLLCLLLPAQHYTSTVYAVALCLFVCVSVCHKSVFCWNILSLFLARRLPVTCSTLYFKAIKLSLKIRALFLWNFVPNSGLSLIVTEFKQWITAHISHLVFWYFRLLHVELQNKYGNMVI